MYMVLEGVPIQDEDAGKTSLVDLRISDNYVGVKVYGENDARDVLISMENGSLVVTVPSNVVGEEDQTITIPLP